MNEVIKKRRNKNCWASFKDLGKKCFAIGKIDDDKVIKKMIIWQSCINMIQYYQFKGEIMVSIEDLKYDFLEFPLEMDDFYKDQDVIKYLEEIKKYKSISKEEEKKLLENNDYEKLFHANLLLAATIAGRFSLLTKSIYPMDLIQEANIGLLEAIHG